MILRFSSPSVPLHKGLFRGVRGYLVPESKFLPEASGLCQVTTGVRKMFLVFLAKEKYLYRLVWHSLTKASRCLIVVQFAGFLLQLCLTKSLP